MSECVKRRRTSYRTIFYPRRGSGPPAGEDGQREEAITCGFKWRPIKSSLDVEREEHSYGDRAS